MPLLTSHKLAFPVPCACLKFGTPPLSLWQDLNYRVNGGGRVVAYLLRSPLHEVLAANDQLGMQRRRGAVFQVSSRLGKKPSQ